MEMYFWYTTNISLKVDTVYRSKTTHINITQIKTLLSIKLLIILVYYQVLSSEIF